MDKELWNIQKQMEKWMFLARWWLNSRLLIVGWVCAIFIDNCAMLIQSWQVSSNCVDFESGNLLTGETPDISINSDQKRRNTHIQTYFWHRRCRKCGRCAEIRRRNAGRKQKSSSGKPQQLNVDGNYVPEWWHRSRKSAPKAPKCSNIIRASEPKNAPFAVASKLIIPRANASCPHDSRQILNSRLPPAPQVPPE